MSFLELFVIAVGLSMDAFAVAICAGLTMAKVNVKKALTVLTAKSHDIRKPENR